MKFALSRDAYTVHFARSDYYSNVIYFKVRGRDDQSLEIQAPERILEGYRICGGTKDQVVKKYSREILPMEGEGVKQFVWYRSGVKYCPMGVLQFRVFDSRGDLLGEEYLPFKLVNNGAFTWIDAI